MASRKRSKGQARKAKAAKAAGWGSQHCSCQHGCTAPSLAKGDAVKVLLTTFLDEWKGRRRKAGTNDMSTFASEALNSLVAADEKNRGTLSDVRNKLLTINFFVGRGVEEVINSSGDPSWAACAGGYAACVMALEGHTHGRVRETVKQDFKSGTDSHLKRMDTANGDTRSLLEFYTQRIRCGCLDERYAASKSQPKTGICDHCRERTERRNLLVCSRCYSCQYCSVECCEANWDRHKDWCRSNPSPRYLANKKASRNT